MPPSAAGLWPDGGRFRADRSIPCQSSAAPETMPVRIGELLLKEKRITPEQLQEGLAHQGTNGGKLGVNLVKLGFVKDEEIPALLSKQYGVPSINLSAFEIAPAVIKLIPAE